MKNTGLGRQLLTKMETRKVAKSAQGESLSLISRCLKGWPSDPSKQKAHILKTLRRHSMA